MNKESDWLANCNKTLISRLLETPAKMKETLPSILSEPNISLFTFGTQDYFIWAFLSPDEKTRINGLKESAIVDEWADLKDFTNWKEQQTQKQIAQKSKELL